jgi:hypothetical protein
MATQIERTIYHPIQRDRVTFLKTAGETGGALTLLLTRYAPHITARA